MSVELTLEVIQLVFAGFQFPGDFLQLFSELFLDVGSELIDFFLQVLDFLLVALPVLFDNEVQCLILFLKIENLQTAVVLLIRMSSLLLDSVLLSEKSFPVVLQIQVAQIGLKSAFQIFQGLVFLLKIPDFVVVDLEHVLEEPILHRDPFFLNDHTLVD